MPPVILRNCKMPLVLIEIFKITKSQIITALWTQNVGFFRDGHCPKKVTKMALILLLLGLLLDFLHYELGIIWDYLRVAFREQKIGEMWACHVGQVRTGKESTNLSATYHLPLNYWLELYIIKFWNRFLKGFLLNLTLKFPDTSLAISNPKFVQFLTKSQFVEGLFWDLSKVPKILHGEKSELGLCPI